MCDAKHMPGVTDDFYLMWFFLLISEDAVVPPQTLELLHSLAGMKAPWFQP